MQCQGRSTGPAQLTDLLCLQNLVDSLPQTFDSPVPEELHGSLNTFVVYNRRRCVTSSAKRRRAPGSTMVSQTPDGSFLDLMRNAYDLLIRCGLSHVPQVAAPPLMRLHCLF